jgi:LPXTG-motif cell wall-anchored protein
MDRRRLAALIAALTLALPGAAFAQSAGDEQYQDPFGGDQSQGSGGQSQGPNNQSTQTPAQSGQQGTQTAQAAPTAAPTAAAPLATTTQATAAVPQLPRTGEDAGLLALGGAVLLAGGVVLRRRVT